MAFSPDRYLTADEEIRLSTRRHPVAWVVPAIGALAVLITAFVLADRAPTGSLSANFMAVVGLAAIGGGLWIYLDWYNDRFVITDGRVMLYHGIFARRIAMMPVNKVTDLTYEVPVVGRMLQYCNLEIESAGQDQALHTIKYLPYPLEVYEVVIYLTHRPKDSVSAPRPALVDEDD
jgi:uncharacterized membrane protein YdbT with pleckstrin-like domain